MGDSEGLRCSRLARSSAFGGAALAQASRVRPRETGTVRPRESGAAGQLPVRYASHRGAL